MIANAYDVVNIALGLRGIDFLRQTLSAEIGMAGYLSQIDLALGEVRAIVPAGITSIDSHSFSAGWPDKHVPIEWLANYVARETELVRGSCYIHDLWARPEDRCKLHVPGRRTLFSGKSLIYFFEGPNIASLTLLAGIQSVTSYSYLIAIASQVPEYASDFLSEADLKKIAKETTEIVLPAFDQDGFVMWRRSG